MEFHQLFLLVTSGCMLAYIPYYNILRKQARRRRSARIIGEVVGHEKRISNHSVDSYSPPTKHPVVRYVVNSKTYQIVSETGLSFELVANGQRIEVAYNPRRPSDAQIIHPKFETSENWIILAIGALGGFIFITNLIEVMGR